jgi:hypothetical protein
MAALPLIALVGLTSSVLVGTSAANAAGAIVFVGSPGTGAPPAKLGGHAVHAFPADGSGCGATDSTVLGPTGKSIGLSPALTHETLSCGGWATWSNGYTGDVYDNVSAPGTMTVTLPKGTKAFYFYAEPDVLSTFTVTSVSTPGTVSSGSVSVNGDAGATFFGYYSKSSTVSLRKITISCSDSSGFAIGEFGISGKILV